MRTFYQIERTKAELKFKSTKTLTQNTLFLSSSTIMIEYITTLCISVSVYLYWKSNKDQDTLPPRAPGYLPIIGHLAQVIKPVPIHQMFHQWSKEVGPIFTCYFGTQRWIVLNSIETIKDLIVERGAIYSSRKLPDTLVHDFMQGGT